MAVSTLPAGGQATPAEPTPPAAPAATTVRAVARPVPPVAPDASCAAVGDAFAADSSLYVIPVVGAEGAPLGIVNRFKFFERLSGRFGRALTVNRPVELVMDRSPLILDEATPIDYVGERFVAGDDRFLFDGFIVTREGRYAAVATGLDLMRAITAQRHAELERLAQLDNLTGLPNRTQFDVALAQAVRHAASAGRRAALLFVDLDRFKRINDTFGHRVGDLLLSSIAQLLRTSGRPQDTVARLSGDEFAVVLHDVVHGDEAEQIAAALRAACSAPLWLDGHEIVVSCSIGVAVYPDDAGTVEGLVQAADAAVYYAKHVRNTHQRYSAEMSRPMESPSLNFSGLRRAISARELTVYYQPTVDLQTGSVCGVEALVRWRPSGTGFVPTEDLIRLAEDSGLIIAVSEHVVQTALHDMLEWDDVTGRSDLRLAVNISSVQLREGGLVAMIDRMVDDVGFERSRLEIELTESAAMRTDWSNAATLRLLKHRGYVLAIDDFGTGYSSLSQLERLPVDILKIDRTFVAGIGRPGRDGAIARAILAMGHSLGLRLVAEGVETYAQLAFLRRERCHVAQGFLFGRPMPAVEMRAFLERASTTSLLQPDAIRPITTLT